MSDESSRLFGPSAVLIVILVIVTSSVALTAGLAIGSGGFLGSGGSGDGNERAELVSLQTFEPRCGTHRSSNSSSYVRPANDGVEISVNETVPVAAEDSELNAEVEKVGERRYLLDLQRTAGNRSTDCYLEMRYNVTVTVPDRNSYTLIRTVDRTFHALEYGDENSGGAYGSNVDLRPPSMSDAEWEAALNASDEYFYNDSRGHDSGSNSGRDGDESGGTSGSGGGSGSLAN